MVSFGNICYFGKTRLSFELIMEVLIKKCSLFRRNDDEAHSRKLLGQDFQIGLVIFANSRQLALRLRTVIFTIEEDWRKASRIKWSVERGCGVDFVIGILPLVTCNIHMAAGTICRQFHFFLFLERKSADVKYIRRHPRYLQFSRDGTPDSKEV